MAAESSDEEFSDVITSDQDEHEQEEGRQSCGITTILLFVLCSLFYIYVLICLFLTLVVPASIAPILDHPFILVGGNRTVVVGDNEALYVGSALLQNGVLLLLFLIQHSLFPRALVKRLLAAFNMAPFIRLVYVFCTCVVLQVINYLWTPVLPQYHLWNCIYDAPLFSVIMTTIHTLCWISIGFSLFTFDYLELFGIKQLYYSYLKVNDPMAFKSWDTYDLLRHMRHPLFLAPLVILWAVPLMTYTRLMVAVLLPCYMLWGNSINDEDKFYVQDMFNKKKEFLLRGKND